MKTFKRGDAIGFGSRKMGLSYEGADKHNLYYGQVIKVTDNEILCWTGIDGGLSEYSFKQLKSGRWILREETRGDDPKNRLHLRHLTGYMLTEALEHIKLCYNDLDSPYYGNDLPQAVKRVRVAA
jgi:hypothetical protein